jgi:hypothetical protein
MKKQKKTKMSLNDTSIKQPPNLPFTGIQLIADLIAINPVLLLVHQQLPLPQLVQLMKNIVI